MHTKPVTRVIRYKRDGAHGRARLEEGGHLQVLEGPPARTLDDVELLCPVQPTKLVGIGLNYQAHAREMGKALPAEPLMFLMPSTAVVGPGHAIVRPRGYERVDYEGELAVVFGKRARHVPAEQALEVVAGFCCFIDVTVRDLQIRDVQYTRAKGFDTFAPIGPCLATGLDPRDLRLVTRVNGVVRQDSSTADMIFDVPRLVAAVTRVMTMLPGDVIATGTPPGVGPLVAGDRVQVEIEGIGVLDCPVIDEAEHPEPVLGLADERGMDHP